MPYQCQLIESISYFCDTFSLISCPTFQAFKKIETLLSKDVSEIPMGLHVVISSADSIDLLVG